MEHIKTIILIIGLFASAITITSFIPLTFRLVRTRQTVGLSPLFSLFLIIAGFFWITYSALLHTKLLGDGLSEATAISASVPIILTNSIGIIAHIINLIVKYQMVMGAKNNHMTEKEYCDLFYQQQLNKRKLKK